MDKNSPNQPPAPKNNWLFILGRETILSTAEITAVFSARKINYKIQKLVGDKMMIETEQDLVASELISKLGGCVKICKKLNITKDGIPDFLNHIWPNGKINFALTNFGPKDWINIKGKLKAMGRGARHVEIRNSASILFNNLIDKGAELTWFDNQIFITQAIQSFVEFGDRDYGRPGRDDKSGMLPPKLAVIMINLSEIKTSDVLLDPFCGSGTIITEALLLGHRQLIGSDSSEKAVADTKQNITWITSHYSLPVSNDTVQVFTSDARKLSETIKDESINTIVTEPFLGKPLKGNETFEEIKTQATELKKLYLGAFEQFKKILHKNSTVVFIIPCFKYKGDWIKIDCLPEIKKLGFMPVSMWENNNFLLYSRPDQHVGREIWKFVKV